jgi:hypothetical protein
MTVTLFAGIFPKAMGKLAVTNLMMIIECPGLEQAKL